MTILDSNQVQVTRYGRRQRLIIQLCLLSLLLILFRVDVGL